MLNPVWATCQALCGACAKGFNVFNPEALLSLLAVAEYRSWAEALGGDWFASEMFSWLSDGVEDSDGPQLSNYMPPNCDYSKSTAEPDPGSVHGAVAYPGDPKPSLASPTLYNGSSFSGFSELG